MNRPSCVQLINQLQDAGGGTERDEPTDGVQPFQLSLLALIQSEKTKQQIPNSYSSKKCVKCQFSWLFFYHQGVSCCSLTELSVMPEAGRNVTAGTFTFQRHALQLDKDNITELLNAVEWTQTSF